MYSRIDSGKDGIVGVNKYRPANDDAIDILDIDNAAVRADVARLVQMWQALLEGRDAITDLPEGRWSEFLSEPRIAERLERWAELRRERGK